MPPRYKKDHKEYFKKAKSNLIMSVFNMGGDGRILFKGSWLTDGKTIVFKESIVRNNNSLEKKINFRLITYMSVVYLKLTKKLLH